MLWMLLRLTIVKKSARLLMLLLLRLIIVKKSAWLTLHSGAEVCKGGRGPGGGYHVGQLLPALLLPGSVGWQQGVCVTKPASCSALHSLYHYLWESVSQIPSIKGTCIVQHACHMCCHSMLCYVKSWSAMSNLFQP